MGEQPALIADIGGTNARFALTGRDNELSLTCADYPDIRDAIKDYYSRIGVTSPPAEGAFALACPISGDDIQMTNSPWRFSIQALRRDLKMPGLICLNDFAALALALPHLADQDLIKIGGREGKEDAPKIVLGPGTGLGAALLIPTEEGWRPVPTEAGHATLPAYNEEEEIILAQLRKEFGHVSAERLISGPGLINLYNILSQIEKLPASANSSQDITKDLARNGDPLARKTIRQFFLFLGTFAADLALSTGAQGGVYLAGGILPEIADQLTGSEFRARFEDKGRFSSYLSAIPSYLIIRQRPALLGLEKMF